MRIDEQKLYGFHFKVDEQVVPVLNGEIVLPIRAETKEDAGEKLTKLLHKMSSEVAMDFPKVQVLEEVAPEQAINIPTTIPPEVLELRIDTLLGDMNVGQLTGKAKADTIKLWTGFDFNEANYTSIITELELIRTGQKEIPTKKK